MSTNDAGDGMTWDVLEKIGEALGKSPSEVEELLERGLTQARKDALKAESDSDVPTALTVLAHMAEIETGQMITAIKKGSYLIWTPDEAPPDGNLAYAIRRTNRQLHPDDPNVLEIKVSGWVFKVNGNPVLVEDWLKEHGFHLASALNPSTCFAYMTEKTILRTYSPEEWNAT